MPYRSHYKLIHMHAYLTFLLICFSLCISAQFRTDDMPEHSLQLIFLNNKINTPYSVLKPQEFMTHAALDRKAIQGVEIDALDLPIDPEYVQKIQEIGPIHACSKWLNAVSVHCTSIQQIEELRQLPFVLQIIPLGKFRKPKKAKYYTRRPPLDSSKHQSNYYGKAFHQINMLQGTALHQLGFSGKGVSIAVVDGGFNNAYRMWVFDSMYLENRLLGTHDFVDGDDYVYQSSTHGTSVLSTMASKRPHLLVGTAPDASYYLFRTEDVKGEYRAEEFNWVVAMEFADSLGVDIVNSSMGYNQFRDTSMSYTYRQMDGKTALISQGASIAVDKGLFIVNAVGNDGNKAWRHLFAPADVATVFSVGAVDSFLQTSSFSSRGPNALGRIKPDITAQGSSTAYATMTRYDVALGEGTSYACPVMTGMIASLKSAFPSVNNKQLKQAIIKSAHQANKPDNNQGYGIPNFLDAYLSLLNEYLMIGKNNKIQSSSHQLSHDCPFYIDALDAQELHLKFYDFYGRLFAEESIYWNQKGLCRLPVPFAKFSRARYFQINLNDKSYFYSLKKVD